MCGKLSETRKPSEPPEIDPGIVFSMETRGIVNGKQVVLEDAVPDLDGQRVRVQLDALDDEKALSPAEQLDAWRDWVESGPQGPIEDDSDGWP